MARQNPQDYQLRTVEHHDNVIWYKDKFYIPQTLRERTLNWYHDMLHHPGKRRTETKVRRLHLAWHGLTNEVKHHVKECQRCQLSKNQRKRNMDIYLLKWQNGSLGARYVSTLLVLMTSILLLIRRSVNSQTSINTLKRPSIINMSGNNAQRTAVEALLIPLLPKEKESRVPKDCYIDVKINDNGDEMKVRHFSGVENGEVLFKVCSAAD